MKKYAIYILLAVVTVLAGCDFLDKNPDQRATIDTKKKVQLLLVSAYSQANPQVVQEMFSDNMEDNNSPDDKGHSNNLAPFGDHFNEMFAWEPVTAARSQDTPYYLWEQFYKAIAVANYALVAIDELEAQGIDMSAEKAEALLCRAYHHFLLATIFCKAYRSDDISANDLGLPYAKEPERDVKTKYVRPSLTQTYNDIRTDLEAALPLVSDQYYTVPRYHFNTSAAYAFATRFYLYTRDYNKAIACADKVLGSDPSGKLFDANYALNINTYPDNECYTWWDGSAPCNLLLTAPVTYAFFTSYPSYGRYQFTRNAKDYTVRGSGPCWTSRFPGLNAWSFGSEYGIFIARLWYVFEYTDKISGTGLYRGVIRHFTTNECLLNRAEAKIMNHDLTGALKDLQVWTKSYDVDVSNKMKELTDDRIKSFYTSTKHRAIAPELHCSDMVPGWTLDNDQLQYMWCVLHFRRIESIHEGLRWQDIKRFGIEIEHKIGNNPTVTKTLKWDDDRKAVQLPEEVILQGLDANPRTNVAENYKVNTNMLVPMPSDVEIYTQTNAYTATKED